MRFLFLLVPLAIVIVVIVSFVFWIKMIVHAVKNPIEHKPLWLLVIILCGIIGAIVYYFAIKKDFDIKKSDTSSNSYAQATPVDATPAQSTDSK